MRKRLKITTMDTQERYFRNSLGHASLPTALFFLADSRALITSTVFGCSAAFFGCSHGTQKGLSAEDSLYFSWLNL